MGDAQRLVTEQEPPGTARRGGAQERQSQHIEKLREWVVEDVVGPLRKILRKPEYRREKHEQLQRTGHDRCDVSMPGTGDAESDTDGVKIHDHNRQIRQEEECLRGPGDPCPNRHRDE